MTRTTIGGIAAGAFTLGLLAGIVVPSALDVSRHDRSMATHTSAMGGMPMMGQGSMPMGMGSNRAMHEAHHSSPEVAR